MDRTTADNVLRFVDLKFKLKNKVILQNINGEARSGELLAVLGPSGSGKTTLLNALSGRISLTLGQITLNNRRFNKRLRQNLAYVLQTDIFLPRLTLWETLYFTAMVQIPDTVSRVDKMSRIDEIVQTLDLKKCLHTVVGNALIRGLSGGEKKRLSIACELLSDPDMLFIDEPTSGLDSRTARGLIENLRDLARNQNKMIVTTIHQPSSCIYHMFSSLLLLVDGQPAYFGASDRALDYFSTMGFHCDKDYNPADFLLQLVKSDKVITNKVVSSTTIIGLSHDSVEIEQTHANSINLLDPDDPDVVITPDVKTDPNEGSANTNTSISNIKEDFPKRKWPTSFWNQLRMLIWRNFKQSKGRVFDLYTWINAFVLGLCVGTAYFQVEEGLNTIRDRMGMIYFCITLWGFLMISNGVVSLSEDRAVVSKDRSAGKYRLSAYYTSKLVSGLLPVFGTPIFFSILVYWMVSLSGLTNFFVYLGVNILNCLISQSIGHVIGALVLNPGAGMTSANAYMLISLLLGGFFNTHSPEWFGWTKYLSSIHYSFAILSIVIVEDTFPLRCNDTITQSTGCSPNGTITATDYLQDVGIRLPLFSYVTIMCFFLLCLNLLGYLLLRLRAVKTFRYKD